MYLPHLMFSCILAPTWSNYLGYRCHSRACKTYRKEEREEYKAPFAKGEINDLVWKNNKILNSPFEIALMNKGLKPIFS